MAHVESLQTTDDPLSIQSHRESKKTGDGNARQDPV